MNLQSTPDFKSNNFISSHCSTQIVKNLPSRYKSIANRGIKEQLILEWVKSFLFFKSLWFLIINFVASFCKTTE